MTVHQINHARQTARDLERGPQLEKLPMFAAMCATVRRAKRLEAEQRGERHLSLVRP